MPQINYYDPEEIRRRQLLNPTSEMGGPEQENPFTAQVNAPEDDGDEAAGDVHATPTPHNAQLSPAMQKYQQVMGQQPTPSQYKPSKGRRIMAAIAGGLSGMRDPSAGVKVAQNITSQPYQRAMGDWQVHQQAAQAGMTMDEKAQADAIARERAGAYTTSSNARMKAAESNEAYRRAQEANMPYHPKTLEDTLKVESAKHPGTGWHPQDEQSYLRVHPTRNFTQEEKVREDAAMARTRYSAGAASSRQQTHDQFVADHPRTTAPTPKNMEEAESIAVQELLRQRPEYKDFVHGAVVNDKTGHIVQPLRVKTADEIPKEGDDNPSTHHFLGLGQKISAAQAALARAKYAEFLGELDKHKRAIVGRRAGDNRYTIEEDQEDQEDQEQ